MARTTRKSPFDSRGRCRRHRPAKKRERRAVAVDLHRMTAEAADDYNAPRARRMTSEWYGRCGSYHITARPSNFQTAEDAAERAERGLRK